MNNRQKTICLFVICLAVLAVVTVGGMMIPKESLAVDFSRKNLPPSLSCFFGTDWMGRDMFLRTVSGLSLSIRIGILTAGVSAVIAFLLGMTGAVLGRLADEAVTWVIDLVMGIPHILLLILISFSCGKGFWGVVIGISLTHWTSLSRVIRAEALQLKESQYYKAAGKLGVGRLRAAIRHMTPHLAPQMLAGVVLLFPHAILHEASITFLGFGLMPEQPAIGMILSESMKYLSMGRWWLAFFPGLFLVAVVMMFQGLGYGISRLTDPGHTHS